MFTAPRELILFAFVFIASHLTPDDAPGKQKPDYPVRMKVISQRFDERGGLRVVVHLVLDSDVRIYANHVGGQGMDHAAARLKVLDAGGKAIDCKIEYPKGEKLPYEFPDDFSVYRESASIEFSINEPHKVSFPLTLRGHVVGFNERNTFCLGAADFETKLELVEKEIGDASATISGDIDVARLGKIHLPEGLWVMENSLLPSRESKLPDCFVFRKLGDRLERITFLRFRPEIALKKAYMYADFVGDSFEKGIPTYIKRLSGKSSEVLQLGRPDDWESDRLELTYVCTSENEPPWMSHSIITVKSKWIVVAVHSSPFAISKEPVRESAEKSVLEMPTESTPSSTVEKP